MRFVAVTCVSVDALITGVSLKRHTTKLVYSEVRVAGTNKQGRFLTCWPDAFRSFSSIGSKECKPSNQYVIKGIVSNAAIPKSSSQSFSSLWHSVSYADSLLSLIVSLPLLLLPQVCSLMARELGWSAATAAKKKEEALKFAESFSVGK